jgi:predicted nucleic acid-binding protein
VTLYLDTSSAIKLYVLEAGSDLVHSLVDGASVVATSTITYAETRAALARLRRERALTSPTYTAAKREFEQQWPSFLTLDPTDALCRTAGELAERYELRGFDSVHLATFAEVARRAGPREIRFSSFDDRLNQAAQRLARRLRQQSSR